MHKMQRIEIHTGLDGWKAGKMCLREMSDIHSSEVLKKIKGGYDFSVKKTILFL